MNEMVKTNKFLKTIQSTYKQLTYMQKQNPKNFQMQSKLQQNWKRYLNVLITKIKIAKEITKYI